MIKRILSIIMMLIIILIGPFEDGYIRVEAATNYIKVSDYIVLLSKEIGLTHRVGNELTDYTNQLNKIGIIKDGDFKNYTDNLKRGDMLVLLSRADDYLNKTEIDGDLVQLAIDKRISDIKKAPGSKKEDIARGFIKGFLKGYTNGIYSTDRNLMLNNIVTKTGAITCLKMLKDASMRARISPEGLLIRTDNLPNNSYMFPYILADFPNKYYEAKLLFEGDTGQSTGAIAPIISPTDYAYPVDIGKTKCGSVADFNKAKELYLSTWIDKVYTCVWNTFNVDYNTIDSTWVEKMAKTDCSIDSSREDVYKKLYQYVTEMKRNKTIVNCDKLVIDSSSMYFYNNTYYFRCYIHYRIKSSLTKAKYTINELLTGATGDSYNSVLFSRTYFVNLAGCKLNEWVDGIYDVGIASDVKGNDGSLYGVSMTDWTPALYLPIDRE